MSRDHLRRRTWPPPASYAIDESESDADHLTIRDQCQLRGGRSITNAAEDVVASLFELGRLPHGRRLFYYDSTGQLDELLHEDGRFLGFRPGPRPSA